MASQPDIKNFEGNQIRTVWSADEGKYYFSVVDVVQVLTEQPDYNLARNYWKTTKNRFQLVTNCNQLKLLAVDGKYYKTDVADEENLLIIAQQIQPQKVEKLKQWLENLNAVETVDTGEIIMYQPDETIKLEVRMDNDTVWLSRQQIAILFDRDVKTIGKHIANALQEELAQIPTVAKFATVQIENGRAVKRNVEFYNLDMILSVGYRVKSTQGIKFRQWSNSILKQYLLKGHAINQRLTDMEHTVAVQNDDIADLKNKVDFFVRTSLPPVEGVFYDGQIFDALVLIISLIKQAKKAITIIDNYVDETVLTMLSKRAANVSAIIYTKQNSPDFQLAVRRYNAQYPPITVNLCQNVHDRFLIIDDTVYLFGASLKDAGKKMFSFIKMQETPAAVILGMVR